MVRQPQATDAMTNGMREDMTEGEKYAIIWRNFAAKHGAGPSNMDIHRKWRKLGRTS